MWVTKMTFWLFVSVIVCHQISLVASELNSQRAPPRFIKQPPNTEILFQAAAQDKADKPFLIECEAEGDPAPTYRWIKNGKHFDWRVYDNRMKEEVGRGTLQVTTPTDEDIGQYQCFAENKFGIATSNSVFVRKLELNSFEEKNPIVVSVDEGDYFRIVCEAPDGYPKPQISWVKQVDNKATAIESERMTLDPEGVLWFAYVNATEDDSTKTNAVYACHASVPDLREIKVGNVVTLKVKPISSSSIKSPPRLQYVSRKSEVALSGSRKELYCIFGGSPVPKIIWKFNKKLIRSSSSIREKNYGKTLVIEPVSNEHEGEYECEASNGQGTPLSSSMSLKVNAIPYFTREPENVKSSEGDKATIICEAKGHPQPKIIWIHNGKPLVIPENDSRRKLSGNTLNITRLVSEDTGNYGCNATNSIGYSYIEVTINVLEIPAEILSYDEKVEAVQGGVAEIKCEVNGAPKPIVKWLKDGQEVNGGRFFISDKGSLHIDNVLFPDAGEYKCRAENKFSTAHVTSSLTVRDYTKFTSQPQNYETARGEPANFRCSAVSDPALPIEIFWKKDGSTFAIADDPRMVVTDDTLTISKTREIDSGLYSCVAKTRLDEITANASLTVQDVPSPPKLTRVTCTERTAGLEWKPESDNRSRLRYYIIYFNTSFAPDDWKVAARDIPGTDTTYSVNLSPYANYTFRVVAVNGIGPSLPSDHSVETCITPPDVPDKNPDDVRGRGTAPDNMVISWVPMPEIDHNGPRFQYKVSWKRDIPGEQAQSEMISDWRVKELMVPNLKTFEKYHIQVAAMNDRGNAKVSPKKVIGYSGEDIPLEPPTNVKITLDKNIGTPELYWSPVSLESVRGFFQGYKIMTWTKDTEHDPRETKIEGNKTSAYLTTLIPNKKNYVKIMAYNSGYTGPSSEIASILMPEGVPEAVQSFDGKSLGCCAMYLKWTPPITTNGVLRGYNLYYRVIQGTNLVGDEAERLPRITDPTQTSAKLAKLSSGSRYRIRIAAYTEAGEGTSYPIERTTKKDLNEKPGKPRLDVNVIDSKDDLIVKVTWLPDLKGNPGSFFSVKHKLAGDPKYMVSNNVTDEDFAYINGLIPGEKYVFKVVSMEGPYAIESDPVSLDLNESARVRIAGDNVALSGWFIGMVLAIVLLLIVLFLVCIIKRSRGGKYAVHEREATHGRSDYPEDPGFHEYSQALGSKPHTRGSMASDPKGAAESDSDSMAEYGEGDTEGMNEEGSFIGQYGQKHKGETTSTGFATLV